MKITNSITSKILKATNIQKIVSIAKVPETSIFDLTLALRSISTIAKYEESLSNTKEISLIFNHVMKQFNSLSGRDLCNLLHFMIYTKQHIEFKPNFSSENIQKMLDFIENRSLTLSQVVTIYSSIIFISENTESYHNTMIKVLKNENTAFNIFSLRALLTNFLV